MISGIEDLRRFPWTHSLRSAPKVVDPGSSLR